MSEQTCKRCLYTASHPFGITFVDGMCSGCVTHREKDQLDWSVRLESLQILMKEVLRRRRPRTYDCVVPVRGDAEDYFVVGNALSLGLRPLVVGVNDYFLNDIGWHNLQNLITYFDVDSVLYNPELTTYKALVRTTLRKSDHILWPAIALHTSYPVHVAMERRIPIVLWGGLQPSEQVGKFSHTDEPQMSQWSRIEHDLFGQDLFTALGTGAEVQVAKLHYYDYPEIAALYKRGIVGIYLSNYLRWDPLVQNNSSVAMGFIPEKQNATFDPYERAGSSVYYKLHDLLRLKRVGYRKCRDHLVREIRHGRITRERAATLEAEYSWASVDIQPFFKWLGVTDSGFRWFVEHRLSGLKELVGQPDEVECRLSPSIEQYISASKYPGLGFLPFHKGISLGD